MPTTERHETYATRGARHRFAVRSLVALGALMALLGVATVCWVELYAQRRPRGFNPIPWTPLGWAIAAAGLILILAAETYLHWPRLVASRTVTIDQPPPRIRQRLGWSARRVGWSAALTVPFAAVLGAVVVAAYSIKNPRDWDADAAFGMLLAIPLAIAAGSVFAFLTAPFLMHGPGPMRLGSRARQLLIATLTAAWVGFFGLVTVVPNLG